MRYSVFVLVLAVKYLNAGEVYPNEFANGRHSVILISELPFTEECDNVVLFIWFQNINGEGKLFISTKYGDCSNGFLSNSIGLHVWSNIEISQVLNGSVYNYTIKINNETVYSKRKKNPQDFLSARVYASDPSYESQNCLIKNLYFSNGVNNTIQSVVIPPPGYGFQDLSYFDKYSGWDIYNAGQVHYIYGGFDIYQAPQGYWIFTSDGLIVIYSSQINVIAVLSGIGYVTKDCNSSLCFINGLQNSSSTYKIDFLKNAWHYFEVVYGMKDADFFIALDLFPKHCEYIYLISVNVSFSDINECTAVNPSCSWSHGVCQNTYGSYLCSCEIGWMLDENSCIDVNECLRKSCFWSNGVCVNSIGSYFCTCERGWVIGQDNNSCVDINECITMSTPCSWGNGICQNTNGSYLCFYPKQLQDSSSFVHTLVDTATLISSGYLIALIPNLNKEFLLTFNFFPNKIDGRRSVICFSLEFETCTLSVLTITVDPEGSLVFIKSGNDHFNKFKCNVTLNVWSNVEITQISTIYSSEYNFTIKINKNVVFFTKIKNEYEYVNVRVYASDTFYTAQDSSIEKFYFKNGNIDNGSYPVILPLTGMNFNNIWAPHFDPFQKFYWNVSRFTKELNKNENKYKEPLGFYRISFKGLDVFINLFPTQLENANINFKVSLNTYALQPATLYAEFRLFNKKSVSRIPITVKSNFSISEIFLPFNPYQNAFYFEVYFDRYNNDTIYLFDVNPSLEDIDECNDIFRCPWTNSQCENTFGSYLCKCQKGWILGNDNSSCIDYNECSNVAHPCSWSNGLCQNTIGSYVCTCESGWRISLDDASCVDIDECNETSPCHGTNVVCKNNFGSYLCKCDQGWKLDNYNVSCVDIDECKETSPCHGNNVVCENRFGSYLCKCNQGWKLDVYNDSCIDTASASKTSTIVASIVIPLLIVIIIVITAVWIHKKKKKSQPIFNTDIYQKEKYLECEKKSADKWEINPNTINIDKKIGEGAFGNVFIANIDSNIVAKTCYGNQTRTVLLDTKEDFCINVAVKFLKDNANQSELNDFVEEIDLLKGIGYHKNIVNMIGCSTLQKPLCFVVEYMGNGDLLQFLKRRREKILKINSTSEEVSVDDNERVTPNDLISFAWQVASGMEYLSSIKLVHRDLAARNILVGADKIVKISDFALTRKVKADLNYMDCNNCRLPIKWMSIEAIFDQTFTTCSDVWAFGIVLFEIVTLGGTPYPTISNRELLPLLKTGYRMERPDNCSQFIFNCMLQCWNEDPLQRPTFSKLRDLFEKLLSQSTNYLSFEIDKESIYYKETSITSNSNDFNDLV
ncbi:uncharacterized protein LOC136082389 isoform X2 [Hydra vulgaris]|uniref:Uncharacterized protein LOC136082389 isoform X2 n=1 Tax=Hydra vulgaris TaxID=6087 RepID=A0ABM4C7R2_HYDVU